MNLWAFRWGNGDVSLVMAEDPLDALARLDEIGDVGFYRDREDGIGVEIDESKPLELRRLKLLDSCLLNFRLRDDGELDAQSMGSEFREELYAWAYPELVRRCVEIMK